MPAIDLFKGSAAENHMPPPRRIALVVPSDTEDLPYVSRAIAMAGPGAIKITTADGQTVILPSGAFAAGIWHPMEISRIWLTDTTATGLVMAW